MRKRWFDGDRAGGQEEKKARRRRLTGFEGENRRTTKGWRDEKRKDG